MKNERIEKLQESWELDTRWKGITRPYSAEDVIRLRGSIDIEHTLARRGAEKLWASLHTEDYINALGALTGNQAMQQVKAGLKAIYLSGWQVAKRCEPFWTYVSRPKFISSKQRTCCRKTN